MTECRESGLSIAHLLSICLLSRRSTITLELEAPLRSGLLKKAIQFIRTESRRGNRRGSDVLANNEINARTYTSGSLSTAHGRNRHSKALLIWKKRASIKRGADLSRENDVLKDVNDSEPTPRSVFPANKRQLNDISHLHLGRAQGSEE